MIKDSRETDPDQDNYQPGDRMQNGLAYSFDEFQFPSLPDILSSPRPEIEAPANKKPYPFADKDECSSGQNSADITLPKAWFHTPPQKDWIPSAQERKTAGLNPMTMSTWKSSHSLITASERSPFGPGDEIPDCLTQRLDDIALKSSQLAKRR